MILFVVFKRTSQKISNQKYYLGENLAVTLVYFCFRHASLKRKKIFYWIAFFAIN